MTFCKGHDFCVCSSLLHSSVYNRTHELDCVLPRKNELLVLLCPLIISHASSSCLHRLRNGSKSQRGAHLLSRSKQEKVVKKKGKAGSLKLGQCFVLISFLLHLWWRYTLRKMASTEFVKWGRQLTRLVRQPGGKSLGTRLVAKEDRSVRFVLSKWQNI